MLCGTELWETAIRGRDCCMITVIGDRTSPLGSSRLGHLTLLHSTRLAILTQSPSRCHSKTMLKPPNGQFQVQHDIVMNSIVAQSGGWYLRFDHYLSP